MERIKESQFHIESGEFAMKCITKAHNGVPNLKGKRAALGEASDGNRWQATLQFLPEEELSFSHTDDFGRSDRLILNGSSNVFSWELQVFSICVW